MLKISYGNFLRKSEQTTAAYEYNKPLFLLVCKCFFVMSLGALIIGAVVLGYLYLNKPVKTYDASTYETALRQTNNLAKSVGIYKDARPNGIDVCSVIESFMRGQSKDIDFKKISITPKKYVLTAWTKNMAAANEFTKNLVFDDSKTIQISTVKVVEDTSEFLVSVTDKGKIMAKGAK